MSQPTGNHLPGGDNGHRERNSNFYMTFRGRQQIFRDFERFLGTQQTSLAGLPKRQMKDFYNKDYTIYKRQISPNDRLPVFYNILQMFYSKGIGHFHDGLFQFGPPRGKRQVEKRNQVNTQGSRSSPDKNSSENGSVATTQSSRECSPKHSIPTPQPAPVAQSRVQRRMQLRSEMYKIAVDQHLTAKPTQQFIHEESSRPPSDQEGQMNIDANQEYDINVERRGLYHVCVICQTRCTSRGDIIQHLQGKKHRLAVSLQMLKKKRPEMVKGSHGLDIVSDLKANDGTLLMASKPGEVILSDLIVVNNGTHEAELLNCEKMKRLKVFTLNDSKKVTDGSGRVKLKPGEKYQIQLRTMAEHVGTFHIPVVFKFDVFNPEKPNPEPCYIVRYLCVRCTDSIVDELQPTATYKKPPRVAKPKGKCSEIVPGLSLKNTSSDGLEKEIQLGQHNVPQDLRKMINRGLVNETHLTEGEIVELKNLRSILGSPLTMDTYKRRFKALLYLEEVQMEVDIRKYDLEGVTMKVYQQNKRLLMLEVPGLSENRPSILKGDWLFVRIREADGKLSDREYQGFVHEIQLNFVCLGFAESFMDIWIDKMAVDVRFVFNRLPLRLQHRSCCLADELSLGPLLFPKDLQKKNVTLPKLKLYNQELEKNDQQMRAVQHIVAGTSCPAPYIIFGPPGTGKTVTVVEAMKQVWKLNKDAHILACAPSNSAADLITRRLLQHIPKKEVFRLNAMSRTWSSIPNEVKEVCNYNSNTKDYYYPRKTELMEYRVLVTTLVTAGRLSSANFPAGHFTHVFIDEGGHSVEPEAVIGIAGIMECSTLTSGSAQVVIAGDPRQLGPVLRSPLAIEYGLDISLLERLMISCDLYQPMTVNGQKRYDARAITKLLKNYRSHPAILKLPNSMFYDSELEACANPIARERLCHWEGLPKRGFPLVFHSVIGSDMREERSPSFFNAEEASVAVKYAEELMACKKGGINIKPEDIGIITPYRKQVEKIKQVLRKKRHDKITVGSVEEFQGQERMVIIVSTVRSKPEYLSLDLTYNLGFLRNPKRFNVTLTRAKALLVVIGNPNTLSKDPHWKGLIDYCEEEKSYKGLERMAETEEIEDICQRLNAVRIIDEKINLTPEIQTAFNEQPWRGDI